MAENDYIGALSQFNSMTEQAKQYGESSVADAQKAISEKMDGLVGGTLGMIPVVEMGAKYLGKALGKQSEGLITKGGRAVKGAVKDGYNAVKAKIKAKTDGNNDGGEGEDDADAGNEDVEMDTFKSNAEPDNSGGTEESDFGGKSDGASGEDPAEPEPVEPDLPPEGSSTEMTDMSDVGDKPPVDNSSTPQGEGENENAGLDDSLDNDGGMPKPSQPTAEGAETSAGEDLGKSAGDDIGKQVGEDLGKGLGTELGTDVGVETGLNALDAVPILGELGMVAGAIYGLVHLFHHSAPKPPPTYSIAMPTMDVDGGALNASSAPIAHT